MRWSAKHVVLASVLAWCLFPGTRELAEQVVHLVQAGHLAHAIPDDPDAVPTDSEHGCQGPMHLCLCCHNVPLLASAGVVPPTPPLRGHIVASASHDFPYAAHLDGVFRPPRA